jgi:hypothetical protein
MRKNFSWRPRVAGLTAFAAIVLVALAAAGSSSATPSGFGAGPYVSIAGTNLHASQVGSSSDTFTNECSSDETNQLGTGEVLWHFVLVQTTALNSGELRASFTNAGVTTPDVVYSKYVGGVVHWNVITPGSDTLLAASTTASGAILNLSHVCGDGGGGSGGETSSISTTVHLGTTDGVTPTVVDNLNPAALGSSVHDSANLTFTGGGTLPTGSTVFFSFFTNNGCTGDAAAGNTASVDVGGDSSPASGLDPVLAKGPLGAGDYSYIAVFVSGDSSKVADALGDCEPFKVSQGTPGASTAIHRGATDSGAPIVVTGNLPSGSIVHDSATVTGITGFAPTGTVTFTWFTNSLCTTGTGTALNIVTLVNGVADPSTAEGPLAAGSYAFQATYNGDVNYTSKTSDCEPLTIFQAGRTMGFWGNQNGIARIDPTGTGAGYATNAVAIGRGSNIDTKAESLKVLPNTLNACGKGSPSIFTVGAATATKDCTVASGVNVGSLNTLSAQTLALGYNILLVSGYTGQSISLLGCTAYVTAGLTGSSTVNAAFTAAVALINGSAAGGTTTQSQIGAMNLLLGCLNREI